VASLGRFCVLLPLMGWEREKASLVAFWSNLGVVVRVGWAVVDTMAYPLKVLAI